MLTREISAVTMPVGTTVKRRVKPHSMERESSVWRARREATESSMSAATLARMAIMRMASKSCGASGSWPKMTSYVLPRRVSGGAAEPNGGMGLRCFGDA